MTQDVISTHYARSSSNMKGISIWRPVVHMIPFKFFPFFILFISLFIFATNICEKVENLRNGMLYRSNTK